MGEAAADDQRRTRGRWGLGVVIPFGIVAWFIARYGVDVTYWDEWMVAEMVTRAKQGHLAVGDLFAMHSGHWIAVAKLVHVVLGWVCGWNKIAEMYVSLGVVAVTAWMLHRIARRTVGHRAGAASAVAAVMLFSLVQFFNWLWGFQLALFLAGMWGVIGIWAVAASTWSDRWKIAGAVGTCVLASLSVGSGLFWWPILGVLLWFGVPARRKEVAGVWAGCIVVVGLAYVWSVRHSPHVAMAGIGEMLSRLGYVPSFLGIPLGWGLEGWWTSASLAMGILMMGMLGAVLAYLVWRGQRPLWWRAAPWLAVAGYAVVAAVAALQARSSGPTDFATVRYATFSGMLPVGLVYLVALVLSDWDGRKAPWVARGRAVAWVLVAMVVIDQIVSWPAVREKAAILERNRLRGKAGLELLRIDPRDSVRMVLFPFFHDQKKEFVDLAERMDDAALIRPPMWKTADMAAMALADGGLAHGRFERVVRDERGLVASGWAILPEHDGPADAVILAAETADGRSLAVTFVDLLSVREDVAGVIGDRRYLACGWLIPVDETRLPSGTKELSAWAYDARSGRAHRLEGVFALGR